MPETRGHCPKCGRFCGDIKGYIHPDFGLQRVTGRCGHCRRRVNMSEQDWSVEDFEEVNEYGRKRPQERREG